MNENGLMIWLKSVETRLGKYGAVIAKAECSSTGWQAHIKVGENVPHHPKADSLAELMSTVEEWVYSYWEPQKTTTSFTVTKEQYEMAQVISRNTNIPVLTILRQQFGKIPTRVTP